MNNVPHCFSCFFALVEADACLVFKSSEESEHVKVLKQNGLVGGTVLTAKTDALNNEGMQFHGALVEDDLIYAKARDAYYKRFPFAMAVAGSLFVVQLTDVKHSKTTLGMRHKTSWQRSA